MNDRAPLTISFPNYRPENYQENDAARWKTEDAPTFPGPFCHFPPKQPCRQESESRSKAFDMLDDEESLTIATTSKKTQKAPVSAATRSAPCRSSAFRIRRMLQAAKTKTGEENRSSPPQRPDRQISVPRSLLTDSHHSNADSILSRSTSQAETTTTANEADIESTSLDGTEFEQLHAFRMTMDESFRDLSPSRPTRQRTDGTIGCAAKSLEELDLSAEKSNDKSNVGAPQKPAWVKLWESNGEDSNDSEPRFWDV